MKFGRNVLQVNTHRLTESDFQYDIIISRRRPWHHFMWKSVAAWWVHTASAWYLCSSIHQFVIYNSTLVLV